MISLIIQLIIAYALGFLINKRAFAGKSSPKVKQIIVIAFFTLMAVYFWQYWVYTMTQVAQSVGNDFSGNINVGFIIRNAFMMSVAFYFGIDPFDKFEKNKNMKE